MVTARSLLCVLVLVCSAYTSFGQALSPVSNAPAPSLTLTRITTTATTAAIVAPLYIIPDNTDSLVVVVETTDSLQVQWLRFVATTPAGVTIDTVNCSFVLLNATGGSRARFLTIPLHSGWKGVQPLVYAALTGAQSSNNSRLRVWLYSRKKS